MAIKEGKGFVRAGVKLSGAGITTSHVGAGSIRLGVRIGGAGVKNTQKIGSGAIRVEVRLSAAVGEISGPQLVGTGTSNIAYVEDDL